MAEYNPKVMRFGFTDKDGDYISNTYGMFSEAGDVLVEGVVAAAIHMDRSFEYVMNTLENEVESVHPEVTDTAVREAVYEVMRDGELARCITEQRDL